MKHDINRFFFFLSPLFLKKSGKKLVMPNPFIGISVHQRLWIIYFIVTAVILTIGTVIGFGVELNEIRLDKQQSGRVIYVGFLCAGGTVLLIGITFLFFPVEHLKKFLKT